MLSNNQIQNLIVTIRQLAEKARVNQDYCEYYRLFEELRLAEAALKVQPAMA